MWASRSGSASPSCSRWRRIFPCGKACAWRSRPGFAFICAQLFDIALFHRLRSGLWWRAPLVSSLSASALDTAIFFSAAFALTGLPWVTWALGDFGTKVGMAAVLLIPFRLLMPWIVPSLFSDPHAGAPSPGGRHAHPPNLR